MSVSRLTKFCGGNPYWPSTWTRPTDWMAMPTVSVGEQKICILIHAYPNATNSFALTVAGAYTVDWGDGTAPANIATGVLASHAYDYTALSAGTATSDGARQCVATITMQAGQTMTSVTLNSQPTSTTGDYAHAAREIVMAGASVSTLNVSSSSLRSRIYWFTYVGGSSLTTLNSKFVNAAWLKGLTGTAWTSSVTDWVSIFQSCVTLEQVPLLDTGAATSMGSMFSSCVRLRTVPLFNTVNVTTMANMFANANSLTTIPLFNTANLVSMSAMFQNCSSLQSVPALNTVNVTSMNQTFSSCVSLRSFAFSDFSAVTDANSMCTGCTSLTDVPTFTMPNATVVSNMFTNNTSLPALVMSIPKATSLSQICQNCASLQSITINNSTLVVNAANAFVQCPALRILSVDLSGVTSSANAAFGLSTTSLSSAVLTGLRFAPTSFASQQLSATALDALYTSLGTASGAQTITVTNNPGIGTDTPSIATGKGWTVTGS